MSDIFENLGVRGRVDYVYCLVFNKDIASLLCKYCRIVGKFMCIIVVV